jgi:hypothetical protein
VGRALEHGVPWDAAMNLTPDQVAIIIDAVYAARQEADGG